MCIFLWQILRSVFFLVIKKINCWWVRVPVNLTLSKRHVLFWPGFGAPPVWSTSDFLGIFTAFSLRWMKNSIYYSWTPQLFYIQCYAVLTSLRRGRQMVILTWDLRGWKTCPRSCGGGGAWKEPCHSALCSCTDSWGHECAVGCLRKCTNAPTVLTVRKSVPNSSKCLMKDLCNSSLTWIGDCLFRGRRGSRHMIHLP